MGVQDYQLVTPAKPAITERPEMQALHKVIKHLKPQCYVVRRYAYLRKYDYYIVETNEFKLGVYQDKNPSLYLFLQKHKLRDEVFWICVDEGEYYVISRAEKAFWGNANSENSIQFWLESDHSDMKLPNIENLIDDIAF